MSENETEGKKKRVKETLRDLSLCLPLQFCPICLNCLADLSEKKHMLNVKKQQNMTDHLHFDHLAPWRNTLNCVFFPWRQTTRPVFN